MCVFSSCCYNWFALIDKRGIAPEGFRIPNNEDFSLLLDNYIGRDRLDDDKNENDEAEGGEEGMKQRWGRGAGFGWLLCGWGKFLREGRRRSTVAVAVTEGRLPPPCELDLRAFSFFWFCFFASGFFLWSTCFFSCGLSSLRAARAAYMCACKMQATERIAYKKPET
jgi:hypothetical protein